MSGLLISSRDTLFGDDCVRRSHVATQDRGTTRILNRQLPPGRRLRAFHLFVHPRIDTMLTSDRSNLPVDLDIWRRTHDAGFVAYLAFRQTAIVNAETVYGELFTVR